MVEVGKMEGASERLLTEGNVEISALAAIPGMYVRVLARDCM